MNVEGWSVFLVGWRLTTPFTETVTVVAPGTTVDGNRHWICLCGTMTFGFSHTTPVERRTKKQEREKERKEKRTSFEI